MNPSQALLHQICQALETVIQGQRPLIHQILVALLAGGHVIVEGVPGTGKTLLAKAMAKLLQADFRRIQLTPDVLPADILGTQIFDLQQKSFTLKKGPVFTQILLADEINRTPPKTQAALLEVMEEQQVTLDGTSWSLAPLFWVMATQNPLEFEGVYPLPEAQLDRFLFKLVTTYPDAAAERKILGDRQTLGLSTAHRLEQLQPLATVDQLLTAQRLVTEVQVQDPLLDYLLDLVHRSRQHPDIVLGTSPRAAVGWLQASKAHAWLGGRDYTSPDDVKAVALPLLRHRLILKPEAQLEGVQTDGVIREILQQVAVPR